jgi:hypothetical protein
MEIDESTSEVDSEAEDFVLPMETDEDIATNLTQVRSSDEPVANRLRPRKAINYKVRAIFNIFN